MNAESLKFLHAEVFCYCKPLLGNNIFLLCCIIILKSCAQYSVVLFPGVSLAGHAEDDSVHTQPMKAV